MRALRKALCRVCPQQPRVVSPAQRCPPPTPGRAQCSASPRGVRVRGGAATSKEAHSEGSGRVGRRKESPDCWAAAGCCGPSAQSVPPDLAPPALRCSSLPLHSASLPFFLLPLLQALKTSRPKPTTTQYHTETEDIQRRQGAGQTATPHTCPAQQPEEAGGKAVELRS